MWRRWSYVGMEAGSKTIGLVAAHRYISSSLCCIEAGTQFIVLSHSIFYLICGMKMLTHKSLVLERWTYI
jgi:glucose dehydrogenase